eukprot:CAMPEP_0119554348 /NCGR_PEP_ID=MMETSP1352-20130426/6863_1 /TAXON_ID=265584 /ORGANISM="Stauroneis constricta, Strain CCMP1120" /LENGTH=497 /DNA_ID=CAMNT_0007600923 /DNA_START=1 /DNA_END=1494 /DNA_ORIENTATION=+
MTHRDVPVDAQLRSTGFTFDRSRASLEVSCRNSSFSSESQTTGGFCIDSNRTDSKSVQTEDEDDEQTTAGPTRTSLGLPENGASGLSLSHGKLPGSADVVSHTLFIQMQLCKQQTIAEFLLDEEARQRTPRFRDPSGSQRIDIPYALQLFLQIVRAVQHVHENGLIHRDLKPNNCFFDGKGTVKVGDFGLSRGSNGPKQVPGPPKVISAVNSASHSNASLEHTAGVGTRSYASPEQIRGSGYDQSTDIYSLGIILFELCYPMYTGMERHIVLSNLRKQLYPEDWMTKIPQDFPLLHDLLQSMMSDAPKDRPSATSIVNIVETILEEFTISSLDLPPSDETSHFMFLRVEAKPQSNIMQKTMMDIQESMKGAHQFQIVQYGMKSGADKVVMEFALKALQYHPQPAELLGSTSGEAKQSGPYHERDDDDKRTSTHSDSDSDGHFIHHEGGQIPSSSSPSPSSAAKLDPAQSARNRIISHLSCQDGIILARQVHMNAAKL